ncbi:jg17984 [Pararge aegeria aegeria]|uniref:Jg17984 protein n=1 Tax=Pararge aegeria aegeria TaxID=348720 RepID=A0A8S4RZQ7_9NEOP|nr:jg17984 [Pararge aegeria aegeria]
MILTFIIVVILTGFILRAKIKQHTNVSYDIENEPMINATTEPRKTRRKEYLYRLLTNTTRSLIQMEIKARRLEENMRRIKEKTADLLWKNKDKALWHILFKNISRHISIRHEFHQHSSLRRILKDTNTHTHKHKLGRRKVLARR